MNSQSTILNDWSDYWFYEIGANIIPANTIEKNTFVGWSEYQDKPIPKEIHESRKKEGYYNKGIAVITGKLWRGPYAGKCLVAIDLDNPKAIEEFCRNGLEDLKQKTLVEQTANPDKMHVYFIVDREIPNKASDKVDISKSEKIKTNEIPALEVKSNSKGIMFCSYSPHKNGSNYQIKGTLKPEVFSAQDLEYRIGDICDKYGIPYGVNNNNSSNSNKNNDIGPSIQELFSPGTKILEGHNRHLGILRVMDSLLLKNMGFLTLEQIKDLAYQRNQELCVPPLDNKELDRQWKQSLKYANRKIKEREAAKQKQQQDQNNNNKASAGGGGSATTNKTKLEKIDIIEEATRLLTSKFRFATIIENKEILYYDEQKGVYVKDGEILIEKELEKIFEFQIKNSHITEIKDHIMRQTYVKMEEFDANTDIINMQDGLFNWRKKEFFLHTPDYYSLKQIPIKYNPDAIPRRFIRFLREVLQLRDIKTAVELMAYTFIRKNIFEHYFILIGRGANGKNVFVGILSNLHGSDNVSNASLKSLAEERFALIDLVNKNMNIDTESTSIKEISKIKKLTGTQRIRVEQKGQPAFDIELFAKLIFNCNELPTTSDNTDARYRREIIIEFPNQFEGSNDDPDLLKNIITDEEEMSGIFNLIVNSMRTIATRNKIHVNPATISQRHAKAKLIQNPIKAFLDNALAKEPVSDDYETSEDMNTAFERFCSYHQISGPGHDKFLEDLKERYKIDKGRKKMKDGTRPTIWKCKLVKWKTPNDSAQTSIDGVCDEDEAEDEE